MRRVACVTGDRSEWHHQRELWRAIHNNPDLELRVVITGTHLLPEREPVLHEILDYLEELQRESGRKIPEIALVPMQVPAEGPQRPCTEARAG